MSTELRTHLEPREKDSGCVFIAITYRDRTRSIGGPFDEAEARSRAAMLYRRLPGTTSVRVCRHPHLPAPDDGMFAVAATYTGSAPRVARRLVIGPFAHSRTAALHTASETLANVPDTRVEDYELSLHGL
jgi:hypothetical protein